jgi:hypothetical protein
VYRLAQVMAGGGKKARLGVVGAAPAPVRRYALAFDPQLFDQAYIVEAQFDRRACCLGTVTALRQQAGPVDQYGEAQGLISKRLQ